MKSVYLQLSKNELHCTHALLFAKSIGAKMRYYTPICGVQPCNLYGIRILFINVSVSLYESVFLFTVYL